jgi:hypothetical protein
MLVICYEPCMRVMFELVRRWYAGAVSDASTAAYPGGVRVSWPTGWSLDWFECLCNLLTQLLQRLLNMAIGC